MECDIAETKNNLVVSDEGFSGGAKKGENGKRVEVKTKDNGVILDERFGGGAKKRKNGEKRKRGGEDILKGWTKEQELALQRAYFAAKPSPHFWKNVSKLVCTLLPLPEEKMLTFCLASTGN